MKYITNGYELTTSLTNLVIFIVSIYILFNIKNKEWRIFYLLMSIDSLLGTIVHGIIMNSFIKNIIWVFLSISFVFTINMILNIFMKMKLKHVIYLSIILSIILLILFYLKTNFLFIFTMYVLLVMIISFYNIIKNKKKWFVIGYIVQVIGGILLLCKIKFNYLNYNGIYHLFMALTLICFYKELKQDK